MSKLLLLSDTHCGSRVGLTHPDYWSPEKTPFGKLQRETWSWFIAVVRSIGPVDAVAFNGDGIDGSGVRSGGTEQITTDRIVQAGMFAECLNVLKPKKIILTRGTAYHTGDAEDFEDLVTKSECLKTATKFLAMEDHAFFTFGGVTFSMKHHIGTSGIPHGRATALLREGVWNAMLAEIEQEPRADVLVRSHAHYFMHVDDGNRLGFILPALQSRGTKYGLRRCSGATAFGLVEMDCERGVKSWRRHLLKVQSARPTLHAL